MEHPQPPADEFAPLERLFGATSIAVIGASADPDKIGGRPLRYLRDAGFTGRIHPVNPHRTEIMGHRCHPDLRSIGEPIDVAVVAVAADAVPAAIDDCIAAAVPFAIVFSSGFAELGAEGRERQAALVERARRGGVRIVGPNSLGIASSPTGLMASFATLFDRHPTLLRGRVGFISQSGALGVFIYAMAQDHGLGFSRFVSIGNESDLDVADFLAYMARDPETAVIGGYLEGLGDGCRFMRAAALARAADKPMAFMKVGRSEAGRRAAESHTGSLAGQERVYAAALRQAGVVRVADPQALVDFLAFHGRDGAVPTGADEMSAGSGVAVLTISGGAGVWCADRLADHGVALAELTETTRRRLTAVLPSFASPQNPLDATGQIVNDPGMFDECLAALLDDPGVGSVIVVLGLQERTGEQFARQIIAARDAKPATPILVSWLAAPDAAVSALAAAGVPVFGELNRAVDLAAATVRVAEIRRATARNNAEAAPGDRSSAAVAPAAAPADGIVAEDAAKDILRSLGIAVPRGRLCASVDEAVAVAAELGGHVALKAQVEGVAHKTEHSLVRLGLDAETIGAAADEVMRSAAGLDGRLRGLLVEEMAPAGVDVIVGCVTDEVFGPTVMFGLGGVLVELFGDVAFRIAPVGEREALEMIDETIGAALLDGYRGQATLDRTAVARIIATTSEFAAREAAWVREIEINPVRVHPHGAMALDALIVAR